MLYNSITPPSCDFQLKPQLKSVIEMITHPTVRLHSTGKIQHSTTGQFYPLRILVAIQWILTVLHGVTLKMPRTGCAQSTDLALGSVPSTSNNSQSTYICYPHSYKYKSYFK